MLMVNPFHILIAKTLLLRFCTDNLREGIYKSLPAEAGSFNHPSGSSKRSFESSAHPITHKGQSHNPKLEIDFASDWSQGLDWTVDFVRSDAPSDRYDGPRNEELLEALSAVSASSGRSGTTNASLWSSDLVYQSQKMVDWILDRLGQMSDLSRDLAFEKRFAELAIYPEVFSDGLARDIYPHSKDVVRKMLPDAFGGLQIRIAVAICLRVKELVQSKDQYQHNLDGPYHPRDEDFGESGDHEQVIIRGVKRRRFEPGALFSRDEKSPIVEDIELVDSPESRYLLLKAPPARPSELHSKFNSDETPAHTADDQPNLYVCIVPECEVVNRLYKSQAEWLEHTDRTHAPHRTWICTAICHGNSTPHFDSVVQFQNHMWDEHRGSFSASDLRYLTEACERPACSMNIFYSCPLCKERIPEELADTDRPLLGHLDKHFTDMSEALLQILPYFAGMIDPPMPMQQWKNSLFKQRWDDRGERNIWLNVHLQQLPEG